MTCEGLTGTDHHCSEERLRKLALEWKLPEKFSVSDHDDECDQPPISAEGFRNSHMLIGHWASEVDYEMRKNDDQIFGPIPQSSPPDHILELLEKVTKFGH